MYTKRSSLLLNKKPCCRRRTAPRALSVEILAKFSNSRVWTKFPETRIPVLTHGFVRVILRSTVVIQYRLVTDRQTDGHGAIAYTVLA